MNMKGTPHATYEALSGASYTADANGIISDVADNDVTSMLNAGCSPLVGFTTIRLPLTAGKNAEGTTLLATGAAATDFTIVNTVGTSQVLNGTAAQNNSKTDDVIFDVVLPDGYSAGEDFEIVVSANRTGSGTSGTSTVDAKCWGISAGGTATADMVTTAAQNMTASAVEYTFTVDGANFSPGNQLQVQITTVQSETANSNTLRSVINSVRLQAE